uniref:Uncharacterized protein n=1 Tax=Spermophilus dauricus TaxID=99837 RepID=A0A8C9QLZ1_SPEDA
ILQPGAWYVRVVLEEVGRVVAALSEDMKPGPNPYGVPWDLVMCRAIGCFCLLLFLLRSFQYVKSRLYVGREKQLALKLSRRIKEKCELLEKVSLIQKEHEGIESTLKGGSFEKGPREAPNLKATYEKLHRSKPSHGDERLFLEKELEEQKARHCKQDEIMADISRRIKSLEGELGSLRSQITESKTNLRLLQMSEEGLQLAMKEALDVSSQLQQCQKPIIKGEAEAWREQGCVQCKESTTLEDSQVHAGKVQSDKENHEESLTEGLLKMKDRSSPSAGAQTDVGNLEWGMRRSMVYVVLCVWVLVILVLGIKPRASHMLSTNFPIELPASSYTLCFELTLEPKTYQRVKVLCFVRIFRIKTHQSFKMRSQ